jgi:hypothetical protein
MIVVRVELWSARTGQVTELARMGIDNVSGGGNVRDYRCRTWRGRSAAALDRAMQLGTVQRQGRVDGHRSLDLHVWYLVAKALLGMGYGKDISARPPTPSQPSLTLRQSTTLGDHP